MARVYRIALRMLFADRLKYIVLVCGLAFAVLLITQQCAVFLGLLIRATGPLQNIGQADIWVAGEHTYYVDMVRPMSDRDLYRVRAVPGVEWAEPFFYFSSILQLPDGRFTVVQVIGVDRQTMIGQPPTVLSGNLEDLQIADAVMLDKVGRWRLADVQVGDTLRLNDRRALVVGFCNAKKELLSKALLYTTYDNAMRFVPLGRQRMTYILVKAKAGHDPRQVAAAVSKLDGVHGWTADEMRGRNIDFILYDTSIGLNFAITVALGMFVGLVVSMSTFNQFTADNLAHYAVIKAMGATSRTLIGMVIVQAAVVGLIGYGLGVGLAAIFTRTIRNQAGELVAYIPWELLVVALVPMLLCVGLGALVALRRVLRLDPATVFA